MSQITIIQTLFREKEIKHTSYSANLQARQAPSQKYWDDANKLPADPLKKIFGTLSTAGYYYTEILRHSLNTKLVNEYPSVLEIC